MSAILLKNEKIKWATRINKNSGLYVMWIWLEFNNKILSKWSGKEQIYYSMDTAHSENSTSLDEIIRIIKFFNTKWSSST